MKKFIVLITALLCYLAADARVICGDERIDVWVPMLRGKRVCLLTNYTATIDGKHIADVMLGNGINLVAIATPEHGLSGRADAGAKVGNSVYGDTGIPIWSLFGDTKELTPEQVEKFDVLVFDIQDIGVRFFTYYATLVHQFEVLAEKGRRLIVFDRPNPIGMLVDGPIRTYESHYAPLPIPLAHGMTIGELMQMAVGEGWTPWVDVEVVCCQNYTHQTLYQLPVKPGPNVRTMQAVYLYPSTCLIEGTVFSEARGTEFGFEAYGHPDIAPTGFSYTPRSIEGAKHPKHLNKLCHGVDLRKVPKKKILKEGLTLKYVIDAYNRFGGGEKFFAGSRKAKFFRLTGVTYIYDMILAGKSAEEIKAMWQDDVEKFKTLRRKYLLYKE